MPSATAAEWILSLFTPPDRAASTVGDLLEESSARGPLWFWFSVLRTACSHVWRDLSGSPWQMVYLAFWGLLVNAAIAAVVAFPVLILVRLGHFRDPRGFYSVLTVVTRTAVPLVAGWTLARRSKGRELAAVLSVALLTAVWDSLVLGVSAVLMLRGRPLPERVIAQFCTFTLFLAAGAIRFRRRAVKGAVHA